MPAWMSVKGLYDWDNTLFNGLALPSAMDKNTMINYIIMECSDLEIVITDSDTLKIMIESWSISRLHSWERLYESTVQNYNMIHNYDRYEDWTDNGTASGKADLSKTAYNEATPALADRNETEGKSQNVHRGHMYGNIGVTTAAQMIQGERDINLFDVYQAIADEFKRKFCACVY